MSNDRMVDRDERTVAVENASYSLGFKAISYAILLDVAYRGIILSQSSWDLLAIVIGSGLVTTLYQNKFKILTRSWLVTGAIILVAAAIVAALIAFMGNK